MKLASEEIVSSDAGIIAMKVLVFSMLLLTSQLPLCAQASAAAPGDWTAKALEKDRLQIDNCLINHKIAYTASGVSGKPLEFLVEKAAAVGHKNELIKCGLVKKT